MRINVLFVVFAFLSTSSAMLVKCWLDGWTGLDQSAGVCALRNNSNEDVRLGHIYLMTELHQCVLQTSECDLSKVNQLITFSNLCYNFRSFSYSPGAVQRLAVDQDCLPNWPHRWPTIASSFSCGTTTSSSCLFLTSIKSATTSRVHATMTNANPDDEGDHLVIKIRKRWPYVQVTRPPHEPGLDFRPFYVVDSHRNNLLHFGNKNNTYFRSKCKMVADYLRIYT